VTQARRLLSSSETDWSIEQRREIETLVNDIEHLRDVVCSTCSCCLLFTDSILRGQLILFHRSPFEPLVLLDILFIVM